MNMNENSIRDRLVDHGQTLFQAPKQLIQFTKVLEADVLLNDLDTRPHAFVLACVMDRQVKAEKAWLIPYRISEKLHGFSMDTLSTLSRADVNRLMTQPEPLHRFVDKMSECFHLAVQRISNDYAGDASRIWTGRPSSAEVVYRFLAFNGVGPKIGSMAANILAREFKIPFADYFSIDISADVHVRRVFARLGLCSVNASVLSYKFVDKRGFVVYQQGKKEDRRGSSACSPDADRGRERNAASVDAKTENHASACMQGKDRACLCSRQIQRRGGRGASDDAADHRQVAESVHCESAGRLAGRTTARCPESHLGSGCRTSDHHDIGIFPER